MSRPRPDVAQRWRSDDLDDRAVRIRHVESNSMLFGGVRPCCFSNCVTVLLTTRHQQPAMGSPFRYFLPSVAVVVVLLMAASQSLRA